VKELNHIKLDLKWILRISAIHNSKAKLFPGRIAIKRNLVFIARYIFHVIYERNIRTPNLGNSSMQSFRTYLYTWAPRYITAKIEINKIGPISWDRCFWVKEVFEKRKVNLKLSHFSFSLDVSCQKLKISDGFHSRETVLNGTRKKKKGSRVCEGGRSRFR
jgi:hypothetical protein